MKKYAILIGNSRFPDETDKSKLPDLACPERDVNGLSTVLASERGEFEVLSLKNQPSHLIQRELQRKVKQADSEDLLLLYYSGHGKPNKSGLLHLTTLDTVIAELETSAIPINRVYDILGTGKAKKIVILLDCCYSGAAGQGFKGTVDDQLQQLNNARGTYLVTASTELQVAHESAEEGLSLFTKHLIAGLETGEADKDGDGWVSMNELYDYVQGKVVAENPAQQPTKHVKEERGGLFIAKSGRDSRKERMKNLKSYFLNLAKDDRIPHDILVDVLRIIDIPNREQLSAIDKEKEKIIDSVFENKKTIDFIRQWDKLEFPLPNTPNTEFISYKENNLSKPKVKYSRILIGYSCYDEELAKCFLRLLQTGIGIHYKIICIDKFGLTEKIQIEVSESEVAIVLISKSFCDNPYCLYVLGAMWGKVKKCIPIFIPPVTAQDLDALIYGCEAIRINKRKSLNTLFDQIIFEIQLPSPPISQWNTLVSEFLSEFPKYYRNSSEKRMRGEVFLDTYAISISYALQNLLSRIDLSNEIQIYLLVLDIDRQKQINSLHGIETGDKVLESVTSIFSSYDKRFIEKGQCGDDTFFGIFVGKDIEALILSEEILARVSDIPKSMNHEKLWVTASIGVCQYKEGCLINSWKSRVHGALEEARQKGGNRVEIGELPIKFEEVKYSWCS